MNKGGTHTEKESPTIALSDQQFLVSGRQADVDHVQDLIEFGLTRFSLTIRRLVIDVLIPHMSRAKSSTPRS